MRFLTRSCLTFLAPLSITYAAQATVRPTEQAPTAISNFCQNLHAQASSAYEMRQALICDRFALAGGVWDSRALQFCSHLPVSTPHIGFGPSWIHLMVVDQTECMEETENRSFSDEALENCGRLRGPQSAWNCLNKSAPESASIH
jgi:hypothetical protein